jgi:divalent metal cation (Fe/Co/Zn/Cd) transporter
MKEKIGIIAGLLVTILVLITLVFYIMNIGTIEFIELGSFAIVIILVLAATYIIWDQAKNIRKGLPAKDERLINISYKAGYYGFIAAIWSAVGAPLLSDIFLDHELEGHYITAIVVLASAIVFMVSYLYLAWKGK